MPQIFKIGGYVVYFWSKENDPLEPVHVHVAENVPSKMGSKIWILKSGKCLLANNNSKIPGKDLRQIIRIIEANSDAIKNQWLEYFGEIQYYC